MTDVLEYLSYLFYDKELSYSSINTARSALSAFILCDNGTIGQHPLICRFVKGVYQLRTPIPRSRVTWDVEKLLKFLRNWKDNEFLNLKLLSWKLASLIAIVTAQRVQSLSLIKRTALKFDSDGCTIHFEEKLKQTRPNYHQNDIFLPMYEDTKICVVNCLKRYMKVTARLADSNDNLFISYCKPHNNASRDTIARWMKNCLHAAGIVNYTPHSFRSASTSAMKKAGVSITEIMKTAGWSNCKTFFKYYYKPCDDEKAKKPTGHVIQSSMLSFLKK